MSRSRDGIPPQALTFIVWSAITHLNFLTASRDISQVTGRDGWVATVLSFGLVALAVWMPVHILSMFPGESLPQVARRLAGRFVGTLLCGCYVVYWLLIASSILIVHSHLVVALLLPETPRWTMNTAFVLIATYLVRHGLEPLSRLLVLVVPAYSIPLFVGLLIGSMDADLGRLLPVWGAGTAKVFQGMWISFGQAAGMSVVWAAGPYLTGFRGAVRAAMLGVSFVAIPAIALKVLLVARLGPAEVATQLYPPLIFIELLEIPGFTGFHLNALFLAVWIVVVFTSVSLMYYASAHTLRGVVGRDDNTWPVLAAGLFLIVVSNLPVTELDLMHWSFRVQPYTVGVAALGVPFILFLLVYIRRWREGVR